MARKKTETKTAVKSTRKVSSRTGAAAKSVKKGAVKKTTTKAKPASKAAAKTTTKKAASKTTAKAAATKAAATKAAASKAAAKKAAAAKAADNVDAPLSGEALLKKVKELGSMSKEEKAKVCGYSATTKSGNERVNLMKFYNALIEAEGIDLDGKKGDATGRGGRSASYRITVQSNGNLLIGAAYTKQMDLNPGDEFQITLGRKHIKLTQLDGEGGEA